MAKTAKLRFSFEPEEVAALTIEAVGQGGFQSLTRKLQAAYDPTTRSIDMSDDMIGMVVRYLSYKPGGFEGRLAAGFKRNITNLME